MIDGDQNSTADLLQDGGDDIGSGLEDGAVFAQRLVNEFKADLAKHRPSRSPARDEAARRTAARQASPPSAPAAQATAPAPVKQVKRKSLTEAEQTRLPFWPENRRGVSNDMARSALFTVRQNSTREHFRGHQVAALKNVDIIYTGEELRQRDEDVLLQLLHFGRVAQIGDPIQFTAREMLQQLGWTVNSRSYKELAESIDRMKASSIHVVTRQADEERRFAGSLVRSFEYETRAKLGGGAGRWTVTFEPRIIKLFSHVAYTQIDWDQRKQLTPVAKWLHGFYFTHQKPFPMKVDTLRRLCGSANQELFRFRFSLREALASLVTIGFLKSWAIDKESDLVSVERQAMLPMISAEANDADV